MSAVRHTTRTPCSVSQRVMVQLSRPPDAAKATVWPFSCVAFIVATTSVGQVKRSAGRLAPRYNTIVETERAGEQSADVESRAKTRSRATRVAAFLSGALQELPGTLVRTARSATPG